MCRRTEDDAEDAVGETGRLLPLSVAHHPNPKLANPPPPGFASGGACCAWASCLPGGGEGAVCVGSVPSLFSLL